MPSLPGLLRTLDELRGLAEVNVYDFTTRPGLADAYADCLGRGCFQYASDFITCGEVDCWSSFRSLRDRYPTGRILADCEDLASAHAAYLLVRAGQRSMIGIRPGRSISHAVCGVLAPNGRDVRLLDPSVWAGMPPLQSYAGIKWAPVRTPEEQAAARSAAME